MQSFAKETSTTEFIRIKYREYLAKTAVIDRDIKELATLEDKMVKTLQSLTISSQEVEFIKKQLCDIREEAVCLAKVRRSLVQTYRVWLC